MVVSCRVVWDFGVVTMFSSFHFLSFGCLDLVCHLIEGPGGVLVFSHDFLQVFFFIF